MHNDKPNGKIVAFTAARIEMINPIVDQVIAYWDDLRGARLVPTREEIDPRAIQSALPNAFILDRPRPGTVRFRLSGMHLNDVLGMEARGMPVRAICEVPYRHRLMDQVEAVFETPSLLEVDLRADRGVLGVVKGKLAVMPLRSNNGRIDRALGVFVTEGPVHDAPTRFATRGFAVTRLQHGIAARGSSKRELLPAGMAEDQAAYSAPAEYTPDMPDRRLRPRATPGESLGFAPGAAGLSSRQRREETGELAPILGHAALAAEVAPAAKSKHDRPDRSNDKTRQDGRPHLRVLEGGKA